MQRHAQLGVLFEHPPPHHGYRVIGWKVAAGVIENDQVGRQNNPIRGIARNNVNLLIRELKETIYTAKPWVRLGISPFGIYRNKNKTPDGSGSNTNGLQNYDELYADVILWGKKSWIDYVMPQLYWEIGHKAADYTTLIDWWAKNVNTEHLYIGQSIVRTMQVSDTRTGDKNQLGTKMQQAAAKPAIQGNCLWNGYDVLRNEGGIQDSLRNHYYKYPALVPAYSNMDGTPPLPLKKLWAEWTEKGYFLRWEPKADKDASNLPTRYCIYCFGPGEQVCRSDIARIKRIEPGEGLLRFPLATAFAFIFRIKGMKPR